MPRYTTLHKVLRSRRRRKCSKCGRWIRKGAPYSWFKFRRRNKQARCPECPVLLAELRRYPVPEWETWCADINDELSQMETEDDLDALKSLLQDYSDQLADRLTGMEEYGLEGTPTGELLTERKEALDNLLNEVENLGSPFEAHGLEL